ncbi:MAG: MFS transporter [Legionellaceae bacterium]|nr:MFS transporter [Legionellaceae bacterium]MBP9775884.1 MFS transporter [Legionellaceae bacterium]
MIALLRQQPRPFFVIFMLEIWERFGFYTVQGLLVLYFVRSIGFSHHDAYVTFGTFCALIYGMVPLGGYLGDKLLGTKRTIVAGLFVLMTGYALLALQDEHLLYISLAFICVGAALFKSNPSVLLAQCYAKQPKELHAGFTLYYMAINIGALGSLLIGPYVSTKYGYSYAYWIAAAGILLGLLNYAIQYPLIEPIKTISDQRRLSGLWCVSLLGVIIVFIGFSAYLLAHPMIARKIICMIMAILVLVYFRYVWQAKHKERVRLLLVFALMLEAIVFFTLYQQMPTSINVFAVNHVSPTLLGIHIDPQSFQVLNPFWIIMASPFLARLYTYLNRRKLSFAIPYKFALGMVSCSIGFMILYMTRYFANEQVMVSSGWLVASYFFQALGELFVSALGVAMVAELVSPQIMGFVMGMWFLTSSVAGFTGAAVASLTALPKGMPPGVESLTVYTHVFLEIGVITLLVACVMGLLAPSLTRWMEA